MDKILVVDDEAEIAELIALFLDEEDMAVLTAGDGLEALGIARDEHPRLVLTDIMMPRMDGYEAVHNLKAHEQTRSIPVIFLSAKAQPSDIERGKSYGVDDYLTKPFDPAELIQAVERLVG